MALCQLFKRLSIKLGGGWLSAVTTTMGDFKTLAEAGCGREGKRLS